MKKNLPNYIYSMLKSAINIKKSKVPFYRVLDILATDDGDISKVANYFPDIKERELRQAFHDCAKFLRNIEDYASGGQKINAAAEKIQTKIFENKQRLENAHHIKIFMDGCSKGNPGPAGIGFVFTTIDGNTLLQIGKYIGNTTNNLAEYLALKEALKKALQYHIKKVDCFTDSNLLANQLTGKFKIKNPALANICKEIISLSKSFDRFTINYLKREFNRGADSLASHAVREAIKKMEHPNSSLEDDA
jgi:ribonuclease HI